MGSVALGLLPDIGFVHLQQSVSAQPQKLAQRLRTKGELEAVAGFAARHVHHATAANLEPNGASVVDLDRRSDGHIAVHGAISVTSGGMLSLSDERSVVYRLPGRQGTARGR